MLHPIIKFAFIRYDTFPVGSHYYKFLTINSMAKILAELTQKLVKYIFVVFILSF